MCIRYHFLQFCTIDLLQCLAMGRLAGILVPFVFTNLKDTDGNVVLRI